MKTENAVQKPDIYLDKVWLSTIMGCFESLLNLCWSRCDKNDFWWRIIILLWKTIFAKPKVMLTNGTKRKRKACNNPYIDFSLVQMNNFLRFIHILIWNCVVTKNTHTHIRFRRRTVRATHHDTKHKTNIQVNRFHFVLCVLIYSKRALISIHV